MAQVLIISDVHMKPQMFDKADKILDNHRADMAVQLGDLVDDWGQEFNIGLYEETLNRALEFKAAHPDTLWVLGNHDAGYLHSSYGTRESGHSALAEPVAGPLLAKLDQRVIYVLDGVVFTHAGLLDSWVDRQAVLAGLDLTPEPGEALEQLVNGALSYELWQESSPIWARPQHTDDLLYPAKLQVCGHTPVRSINERRGLLSTDTFSTRRDGQSIGEELFAVVDTETGDWWVL